MIRAYGEVEQHHIARMGGCMILVELGASFIRSAIDELNG